MLFVDPEHMANVRWLARRLRVLPLPVTLVPFGTLAQLFQRARSDIGDTVAIELQRAALSPTEQAVKRGVDIVLSLLGLIVLSPLLLAAAIAIRWTRAARRCFGRPGTVLMGGRSGSTSFAP